jgi:hypothetical protein
VALARVVSFDGVTKDRMEEMRGQVADGEPPEGLAAMPTGDTPGQRASVARYDVAARMAV